MQAHSRKVDEIFDALGSSDAGLSEHEARKRLERYGYNDLVEKETLSAIKVFLNQFASVIIWILIAATIISAILGQWIDAIAIVAILVLNAFLGFVQEYRAEKSIRALKKLESLKARVIRDDAEKRVNAKELVPGDVVVLEAGDKIPADARLIEVYNLETQEASLTGESAPITKRTGVLEESTPVADRTNMVFAGTIVTRGRAKAIVVGTGMQTELGKIATLVQEKREPTPLQKNLKSLGKWISVVVVAIAAITFVTEVFFKESGLVDMLLIAVSLAVAAIPEGLPAVVTISLATGVRRMLKRNALVRTLPSVETLGSCTVICADKTGTLTYNQMTVRKLFVDNETVEVTGEGYSVQGDFLVNGRKAETHDTELLLLTGVLCNDARINGNEFLGDPTEIALLVAAEKAGLTKGVLEKKFRRAGELPFESERKMMSVVSLSGRKRAMYSKGAAEKIIDACDRILVNGRVKRISPGERKSILNINNGFADSGLRVLAFSYKDLSKNETPKEDGMIFVGLQAMMDPPRKEAADAIRKCETAGIKVVMITGDHELTARAVGRELGLTGDVVTGKALERMSAEELRRRAEDISIYARVNPSDKLKIIDALKANGHVVAMTGDGVNDAPALKKADIGIAMGVTGTDVAKESSDMILTDDNFASIVSAVEEGRGVYENIRKFFSYLISGNISEVLIIFLAMLLFLPLPLNALQILLINLVTDGLPALALSVDPFEPEVMKQRPRNPRTRIYRGLSSFTIFFPAAMTAVLLAVYKLMLASGLAKAQTAVFFGVVMFEMYVSFASRSVDGSAIKAGLFKNKALILAVVLSVLITVATIYVPFLQQIFKTAPLNASEFGLIALVSLSGAAVVEISKLFKRAAPFA